MNSSNVKYNYPGVVLQDYYLQSFYFQPDFFSYIFQWNLESKGGTRRFGLVWFSAKMWVKNNLYAGEATFDHHGGRPASLLHVTHLSCKADQSLRNPLAGTWNHKTGDFAEIKVGVAESIPKAML